MNDNSHIKYIKWKKKYLAFKYINYYMSNKLCKQIDQQIKDSFMNLLSDIQIIENKKNILSQLLSNHYLSEFGTGKNEHIQQIQINYISFLKHWTKYKILIDKTLINTNNPLINVKQLNQSIVENLTELIIQHLKLKSSLQFNTGSEYVVHFINTNIELIQKTHILSSHAIKLLQNIFFRFLFYDQIPAPFSIMSVLNKSDNDQISYKLISVSKHCLLMANHWLNNPPAFLTKSELNELIVISLFHDLFYYDYFAIHDKKIMNLIGSYIKSNLVRNIVGTHIDLFPNPIDCYNMSDPIQVLTYEWTQMDWYYSSNIKINQVDTNQLNTNKTLNLNDFISHIGTFFKYDKASK